MRGYRNRPLDGTDSLKSTQKIFKGKDLNSVASHTPQLRPYRGSKWGWDPRQKLWLELCVHKDLHSRRYYRDQYHGGIAVTNENPTVVIPRRCSISWTWEFTKRSLPQWSCRFKQAGGHGYYPRQDDKAMNIAVKQLDGSYLTSSTTRIEVPNTLAQVSQHRLSRVRRCRGNDRDHPWEDWFDLLANLKTQLVVVRFSVKGISTAIIPATAKRQQV